MWQNSTKLYHSKLAFVSLVAIFVYINRFNVAFLEQLNVTQQGISFYQKVVYIAADGRSLRQKSIPQQARIYVLNCLVPSIPNF